MNSENQHHTIFQKLTMKVDKLKRRLAISTIRNEPISNEETLQTENELLHDIYPSQVEIGQILREAREDLKNSLEESDILSLSLFEDISEEGFDLTSLIFENASCNAEVKELKADKFEISYFFMGFCRIAVMI